MTVTVNDFDTELPLVYTDEDRAEDEAELSSTEPAPAAPAPEKKKPGPPANPNSTRQQKLAAKRAAANARKPPLTPPKKRAAPNAPAAPVAPPAAYVSGAQTMLGWLLQPMAIGSIALRATATTAPRLTPARRAMLMAQSTALSMDVVTISMHEEALVHGVAHAAESVPWLAAALEKAAKVSPYATLLEAAAGIGLQLLVNHGVMPPSKTFGTLAPEELARQAGIPWEQMAADIDASAPID